VHVISVEDRVEAAMHMGAVGYAVKPTTREELKDVFARLEAKLTQKVKRVSCWWKTTTCSARASPA
jgi:YesN/AraC family two-component response regulator